MTINLWDLHVQFTGALRLCQEFIPFSIYLSDIVTANGSEEGPQYVSHFI